MNVKVVCFDYYGTLVNIDHPFYSIREWIKSKVSETDSLRRFVPKGMDIGKLTVKELKRIEDWVNNYPRKILGYKSASQMTAFL